MAAHQTKLNVIGNNIANVNTYGFKASRVVFSDVLYQNLSTATAGIEGEIGGTNANQLGYGTKVASIDMLNTISSGASTGRALDVYIAGEGYLVVQPTPGAATRYTRVGNLKFDAKGQLTDGAGSLVMGEKNTSPDDPMDPPEGGVIDTLEAIKVDPPKDMDKYTGITIGKSGEITAIKAPDDPTATAKIVTIGYIAIAKFPNNDGLLQDGNGYFMESANSGTPTTFKAGTNGLGATESANLEMSNVDLSQEFTDMIVAQRGFQANSRIITVSDSILEELINLKR